MTAHVLNSELTNIIQESKRRHSDLRNASEKALQDLKALPVTSDGQLAIELQRRPHFIDPFLSACKTRNAKLAATAVNCLQRLIVLHGVAVDRIKDVLDVFLECSTISLDVQLKILQALPPFLQSYSDNVHGDLLSLSLQICSALQQVKASAVSSTASATFQQLVSFVFEKVTTEDDRGNDDNASDFIEILGSKGPIQVRPAAVDAFKVFEDLCLLMDGQKPKFVHSAQLSQMFGLELIATLLTNYSGTFKHHEEQIQTLRDKLMPLITRLLSERPSFPIALRTMRIFCIILRDHLKTLAPDCEIALGLLNHLLEPDGTAPWRRALCMEAFRIIYTTPHLALDLFARFDEKPNRKNVVQNNLGAFVRLASEKPSLIGIAQQSSYPVGPANSKDASQEQAVLEAGGIAGVISHGVGVREVHVSGISMQWSSLKVPCLELIDKSEPPSIPETYSYSLVLTCISSLSEALARTVLPLVTSADSKAKPHPDEVLDQDVKAPTILNEEEIKENEKNDMPSKAPSRNVSTPGGERKRKSLHLHPKLRTIASLIDECWPAVLATCSTFLYAALDADFYRSLIRSFQYFTQVAGLLRLSTPRDAFLTTLAKSAVPSNVFKAEILSTPISATENSQPAFTVKGILIPDLSGQSSTGDSGDRTRRDSLDTSKPSLTPRNLMCMRALINLAIALGPTLEKSWSIVLDTLQKTDLVLAASGTAARARDYRSGVQNNDRQEYDSSDPGQSTLSNEIAAVETAVTRLFQSSEDYPNEAFSTLLRACCDLINSSSRKDETQSVSSPTSLSQQRGVSSMSVTANAQPQHYQFAISKISEIARLNLPRFAQLDPEESGWNLLTRELLNVSVSTNLHAQARSMAVDVLGNAAVGIAIEVSTDERELRGVTQRRALLALQEMIVALYWPGRAFESITSNDLEVHRTALDSLRTLLEQCGETLVDGWDIILSIIDSPFLDPKSSAISEDSGSEINEENTLQRKTPVPSRLSRSAFASAQLICSDFLASLSHRALLTLTGILSRFCSQLEDLNISLTTITLFWNVSHFLQNRLAEFTLSHEVDGIQNSLELAKILILSAEQGSATALWMLLLLRLTQITNDPRPDVRNGAIHTALRILDSCAEQLPPQVWHHCIQHILFDMIDLNIKSQERVRSGKDNMHADEEKTLNITTKIILEGISDTFYTYIDAITQVGDFEHLWNTLLRHLKSYAEFHSYELSEVAFSALSHILSAASETKKIGASAVASAASLWADSLPTSTSSLVGSDSASGEKAFVAYAESIKHIYRLMQADINAKQIKLILDNLHACITASKPVAYTSDTDKLTNLQLQVLELCAALRSDISGIPSMIMSLLASFVALPYQNQSQMSGFQSLTYIAFAKAASEQLQSTTLTHINEPEIYYSGAFALAITALSEAINLKYVWKNQGSEPAMWKIATSSAIAIFEGALPAIQKHKLDSEKQREIWIAVVHIAFGISNADHSELPDNNLLLSDETYDLKSLSRLRDLMIPSLGDSTIAPNILQDLLNAFFDASLMHSYGHYGQTMIPSTPSESPFKGLYDIRFGRTIDPQFNPRLRMSYFCLDELFALVSATDSTRQASSKAASASLAKAAFPQLILRCALPLKMYIADQPLRGRLPTPMSQRLELLHVLRKLGELNCEPSAVPEWTEEMTQDMGGAESGLRMRVRVLDPQKRHLDWLLPLVNRALEWAWRDKEVEGALREVLGMAICGRD